MTAVSLLTSPLRSTVLLKHTLYFIVQPMHNKSILGIQYKLAMFQVSNHIRWTLYIIVQTLCTYSKQVCIENLPFPQENDLQQKKWGNLYVTKSRKWRTQHKSDGCLSLLPLANYKQFISCHKKLLNPGTSSALWRYTKLPEENGTWSVFEMMSMNMKAPVLKCTTYYP